MEVKFRRTEFSSGINLRVLEDDVRAAPLSGEVEKIDITITHVKFVGGDSLDNMSDKNTLRGVVKAHDGTPDPDSALDNLSATTDPTIYDDLSAGFSKWSRWINTVTAEGFILLDPAADAAVWKKITLLAEGMNYVVNSFAQDSNPYILKDFQATYLTVAAFIFPGTATYGTPLRIKILHKGDGVGDRDFRIQDIDNGLTVASIAGLNNDSFIITDLGALSNLPTTKAIFELQGKSAINEKNRFSCLMVEY